MGGGGVDHPPGTASYFSTLQNLIKPFVGAGILALPNAFKVGGVLASAILMAILAIGVNWCIRCLLIAVDVVHAREHDLEYDFDTGKFTPSLDGSSSAPASRASIQSSDDLDESLPPIDGDSSAVKLDNRHSSPHTKTTKVVTQPLVDGSSSSSNTLEEQPAPIYTFREIGSFAYGRAGCLAVDINLIASQLGFCIAYMSFISQNMVMVTDGLTRVEWIMVLLAGWCLLSQIRDIRKIGFTSAFGNAVYLVSLSIIFYVGFSKSCCVSASDTAWIRVSGLPLVFGTGCFALEGIGLVLPVKRAMADQHKFSSVLNVAITFVATCYIVFGVIGYLMYGEAVHSVITDNLGGGGLSDAVRISLSISLLFTYAIQLFPVSEIVDELWDTHVFKIGGVGNADETAEKYLSLKEDSGDSSPNGGRSSPVYDTFAARGESHIPPSPIIGPRPIARPTNYRREAALILSRVGLVGFTAVISIVFPDFGLIVSLVGSFSNSAIAFILPQLFYIKLVVLPEFAKIDPSASAWRRYRSWILPMVIIVLGVLASAVGVYTTIDEMVHGGEDKDKK